MILQCLKAYRQASLEGRGNVIVLARMLYTYRLARKLARS
jgi:hypothetical protein